MSPTASEAEPADLPLPAQSSARGQSPPPRRDLWTGRGAALGVSQPWHWHIQQADILPACFPDSSGLRRHISRSASKSSYKRLYYLLASDEVRLPSPWQKADGDEGEGSIARLDKWASLKLGFKDTQFMNNWHPCLPLSPFFFFFTS